MYNILQREANNLRNKIIRLQKYNEIKTAQQRYHKIKDLQFQLSRLEAKIEKMEEINCT